MLSNLADQEVLLVGFSVNILGNAVSLPPGSVLVVEEPTVVRKRDLHNLAGRYPAVAEVLECEYQVPGRLAELAEREPRLRAARSVVPGVEYAVTAAAELAELLSLPGAGMAAATALRDKYRLRRAVTGSTVTNPPYQLVQDAEQVAEFIRVIGAPCVLKPTGRQASLGVQILGDPAEAATAWALSSEPEEGRAVPDRGIDCDVMVEAMVQGDEYSVELLVEAGAVVFSNVTAKRVRKGRFPVEVGHVLPAPLPADMTALLVDRTRELSARVGFGTGVLHCEWIMDGPVPTLVECAARMPGDEIPRLITLAYDFPFVEAYLALLLGKPAPCPTSAPGSGAIRFLTAPPGEIAAVTGAEEAGALPGVEQVVLSVKPGDQRGSVRSSWDRAGYVLARGDTAAQAEECALAAAATVDVLVR